jgi:hypothetical protein
MSFIKPGRRIRDTARSRAWPSTTVTRSWGLPCATGDDGYSIVGLLSRLAEVAASGCRFGGEVYSYCASLELDVVMAKNMGIQSNDFDILSVNLHWHATLFIVSTSFINSALIGGEIDSNVDNFSLISGTIGRFGWLIGLAACLAVLACCLFAWLAGLLVCWVVKYSSSARIAFTV